MEWSSYEVVGSAEEIPVRGYRRFARSAILVAWLLFALPCLAAIPGNDNFATRTPLSGASVNTTGSNVDATQEVGEPDPSFAGGKSVWWTWTALNNGSLTISTAGSSFDTMISVFTGNILSSLALVAFNDNESNTSVVTFNVTAGTTYQIMVDGALNTQGSISLQLTLGATQPPPSNDNFANRTTLVGDHISNVPGNNVGATRENGEPYHADNVGLKSVWWTWTAPSSGGLTLTTQGSSIDTVLGVYTGNSVSTLTFVTGNDEDPLNPNGVSRVTCNVTAGTTYQIAVDGFEGAEGDIRLRLDLDSTFPVPSNDNFANKTTLTGTDITRSGTNIGSSFEAIGDFESGEPMHLFTFGGKSVWYTWTAPSSGGVTLTTSGLSTSGFPLDTLLAVYTGSQLNSLQFVAGNDENYLTDLEEGDSRATFNATSGTTYQIAVDGYDGDIGTFTLHLVVGSSFAIPANNNFANRVTISGVNTTVSGANAGATLEVGEPVHDDSYGGKSAWWTWTSPGPGFVTIDTINSDFDTLLAVYTGSTLATLSPVASDDESGGNYTSLVKFPTSSGVTYQIAVDGYDNDSGNIGLHVVFTSASYSLSVSTNPIAGGSITISPPPNEGANYAPGTVVTLTAVTNNGASFTGWTGGVTSTNNPVAITMNANKSIVAGFFIIPTTKVWTGGSNANADWTTQQNWSDNLAPNPGDTLVFPPGASRLVSNNDFPANTVFKSITFGDADYVLTGNSISLNNGITCTNTTGTNTVNFAVQLNSNQTFRCSTPATKLVMAGNVALGARTLTAETVGDIAISGVVSGTAGIIKTNSGTLSLLGASANTYSGSTVVNQGTLELGKTGIAVPGSLTIGDGTGGVNADVVRFIASSQLSSASAVTVNSSGQLDLNGFSGTLGSLTMTSGNVDTGAGSLGLNGNVTINSSSAQASITGNLTLQGATRTFNVADGSASTDLQISAVIGDGSGTGGITKSGSGRLQLTAANTYTGTTTVNDGTLGVSNGSALGSTSQGTVLNNNTVLRLSGSVGNEPLTLSGATVQCDNGNNSWSGNVQLSGNSAVNIAAANASLNLSGILSGSGTFSKTGDGSLTLSGSSANTFSGTTTVNQGTLSLGKTSVTAVAGALVIGDGSGGVNADLVQFTASSQLASSSAVTVNSSGRLDLNGFTGVAGSLTMTSGNVDTGAGSLGLNGGVTVNAASATANITGNLLLQGGTRTFDVSDGAASPDLLISAVIANGTGTGGLIKTGAGTLMLSGSSANTYSGTTTVNQGTLLLSKASGGAIPAALVIGDGSGGINADVVRFTGHSQISSSTVLTMNSSGQLDLNGFTGAIASLIMNAGNVDTGAGSLSLLGNVTVNGNSSQANITGNLSLQGLTRIFDVADGLAATDLQVSANISDGGITKSGAGRLVLSGANSYTGVTTVNDGSLAILSASALGSTSQGTILNNGSLVVNASVSGEALTLAGGSLQAETGTNVWTGNLQLNSSAAITIAANASLNLSNVISGGGNLTKGGDGTLVFSGISTNSYSGTTTVNQGALLLSKTTNNAIVGALVIGDAIGGVDAEMVRVDSMQQISRNSALTINTSGLLRLNNSSNAVASLFGNGHVDLVGPTSRLSVGYDNTPTTFSGLISGTGGLIKAGNGTLILTADNTYTGPTVIESGILTVNGMQPASAVTVNTPATLGGNGRVGSLSASGTVSPGSSPGALSCGNVTFSGSTTFRVEINGSSAGSGYDRLNATGSVTLAGNLNATLGFTPSADDSFTIISNDGNDPVVGTFAGLPEGSSLTIGGSPFRISYAAGPGGNDVRLTLAVPPQMTCPASITTNTAPGLCSQMVAFSANIITAAPPPTVTYRLGGVPIASPFSFPTGTHTIVVTATNGVLPDATCSFTVTVADNESPSINCPNNITVTAAGACPVVVNFSPSGADNCGLASLVATPPSGTAFPTGTNIVRVTATDSSGNTNSCSFSVTVLPGPAPILSIALNNDDVVLSWPATNGCYQLQSAPAFLNPPGTNTWTIYSGPLSTNGGFIYATNSAPPGNKFYRLFY